MLGRRVPLFGICFGNQILGRALGLGTYKLRYGHRGINQPVQDRATGRVEVTAHNHGFAVDAPADGRSTRRSAGSRSATLPQRRRRRGPALPGRAGLLACSTTRRRRPARTTPAYLFDRFAELMEEPRCRGATDIRHVLVIGSGPIVIGQACEFDYSGTQACRVLRAEGLRVVLVNSNPATIMTDPEFADATYIEPITAGVRRPR